MGISSIFNKVLDNLKQKQLNKMPKAETDKEDHFQIEIDDAQSWNPETHPEGRGDSHLVDKISYSGKTKELTVTYRDGFTATYENISKEEALAFQQADSKGRWALSNLWDKSYK